MIIRSIQADEGDAFYQMQEALDHETQYMLYEPGERVKNPQRIQGIIDEAVNGDNLLLVAVADTEDGDNDYCTHSGETGKPSEIVGFLSAQRGYPKRIQHTAYIVIGIRSAYQRKGIGSSFFRHLDEWALENDITRLELSVMCPNIAGIRLYEKAGFHIEGKKEKGILLNGEFVDEYYMAKLIPNSHCP